MFRAFNDYIGKINLILDDPLIDQIKAIYEKDVNIGSFTVNVSFNKYIIDIKLKDYSIETADMYFRHLVSSISYPYSHMSIRYNEMSRVKYRFATCREDKNGIYMDVVYSSFT